MSQEKNENLVVESQGVEEPTVDIRGLLAIILRRKWIALATLVISVAAGGLWTARAPRIYRATALVLIETRPPQVLGQMSEVYDLGTQGYWSSQEYYKTQYNVIKSRPVAQKAAARLGISTTVLREALRAQGEASLEARAAGEPLSGLPHGLQQKLALVGLDRLNDREAMLAALEDLDPAKQIQAMTNVNPVKDSRLVEIAIDGTDPQLAASIANAVADAYIQLNLDQKIDTTRSAVDWLSDQMGDLKAKLEASEQALHQFKAENRIVAVSLEDRRSMTAQTLMQLNGKLSDTRAERLSLGSRIHQIEKIRGEEDADAIAAVIGDPLIQQLKAAHSKLRQEEIDLRLRYTAEHPRLIAVRSQLTGVEADLRAEIAKLIASIKREYDTTLDTERRLEGALDEVKAQALDINKKEITFNRLQRERDNNLELYQLVLKRQKEANLTRMLNVNNVRKLEAALVPHEPVSPLVAVNMVMALMVGLMAGLALAFAVDFLDNRIKTQDQIEKIIGLPFLGMIPTIKVERTNPRSSPSVRDHFVVQNPRSSVAECCRSIRTNLLFSSPDAPVISILITSGRPREGKSTTAINLAITMAEAGAKVVVVDTDMRRPRLHRSFGVPNLVGISSAIVNEAGIDEIIHESEIANLNLIPCGPIPPNPAELLLTESFDRLLARLCERFDRVIFDSPPVHAVTDALVLASKMDGVVLVAQAGQTSLPAAIQAKRRLRDVGGRVFGVVLNEVDLDNKEYSTYYDYYYRSGYSEEPGSDASGA